MCTPHYFAARTYRGAVYMRSAYRLVAPLALPHTLCAPRQQWCTLRHQRCIQSTSRVSPRAMATAAASGGPTGAAPSARTALDEMGKGGEFKRKESVFRQWIRKGGDFEPEGWLPALSQLHLADTG